MLSRYLAKKSSDMDAWYLVAQGAERLKKYARAMEAYDKIVTMTPRRQTHGSARRACCSPLWKTPQHGLETLDKALGAGFKDQKALKALLDAPGLLEHDKVEAALKDKGLLTEAGGTPFPASPQTDTKSAPPSNPKTAPAN